MGTQTLYISYQRKIFQGKITNARGCRRYHQNLEQTGLVNPCNSLNRVLNRILYSCYSAIYRHSTWHAPNENFD